MAVWVIMRRSNYCVSLRCACGKIGEGYVRKIILVAICCSVLSSVLTVVALRYRFDVVSPAYAASERKALTCFINRMGAAHTDTSADKLWDYCEGS